MGNGSTASTPCPLLSKGRECPFGKNCAYSHSIPGAPAAKAKANAKQRGVSAESNRSSKKSKKSKKNKGAMPAAPAVRISRTPAPCLASSKAEQVCTVRASSNAVTVRPAAASRKSVDFSPETEFPTRGVYEGKGLQYLCDTGCPVDLISQGSLQQVPDAILERSQCPERLQTANGLVSAETQATLPIHKFGDFIQPYVLESTPDVISIGARCVDQGYAFHWPAKSVYPYFVTPAGEKVFMVSIDNVP